MDLNVNIDWRRWNSSTNQIFTNWQSSWHIFLFRDWNINSSQSLNGLYLYGWTAEYAVLILITDIKNHQQEMSICCVFNRWTRANKMCFRLKIPLLKIKTSCLLSNLDETKNNIVTECKYLKNILKTAKYWINNMYSINIIFSSDGHHAKFWNFKRFCQFVIYQPYFSFKFHNNWTVKLTTVLRYCTHNSQNSGETCEKHIYIENYIWGFKQACGQWQHSKFQFCNAKLRFSEI